jgi:prepilin-type N-terminal cleavage/methylation domain-containing protein
MNFYVKHQAFTLVEVALVLGVIGVLAGAAITMIGDFHSNTEESVLREYYQDLNIATTQFLSARGRKPKGFGEFMGSTQEDLNPWQGITVPLMYNKNNEPLCGTSVPGLTTKILVCDGVALQKKKATYTLNENVVLMQIEDK